MTTQERKNKPINVVLFGQPGVGTSAVVNLIARKNIAKVQSGVNSCPLQSIRYDISIDGMNVCLFETVGLEKPKMKRHDYLAFLEKAYDFVNKLSAAGGIHLLLFCIRANGLTATTQSNYLLFSDVVFQTKVPIALVVIGLEREVEGGDWWSKNLAAIERYGLSNDGYACVTTMTDHTPHQDYIYAESQKRIHELLQSPCPKTPVPEPQDWFLRLGNGMQQFIEKYRQPTQADIEHVLAARLRLPPPTVQRFLDMTERDVVRPSIRDSTGRLQDAPLLIEDIRLNLPHDLTGHVTTSNKYPIASGGYGDVFKGRIIANGKSIDVCYVAVFLP